MANATEAVQGKLFRSRSYNAFPNRTPLGEYDSPDCVLDRIDVRAGIACGSIGPEGAS